MRRSLNQSQGHTSGQPRGMSGTNDGASRICIQPRFDSLHSGESKGKERCQQFELKTCEALTESRITGDLISTVESVSVSRVSQFDLLEDVCPVSLNPVFNVYEHDEEDGGVLLTCINCGSTHLDLVTY